jgi:hypothetical protein
MQYATWSFIFRSAGRRGNGREQKYLFSLVTHTHKHTKVTRTCNWTARCPKIVFTFNGTPKPHVRGNKEERIKALGRKLIYVKRRSYIKVNQN